MPWSIPPSAYAEINDNGQKVVLFHYPIREWAGFYRGAVHLFGHCHGTIEGTRRSIDVGVDCWNFEPVSLPEAMQKMAGLPEPNIGPTRADARQREQG